MIDASRDGVKKGTEVSAECPIHTEAVKTKYKFTDKEIVANSLGFLMAGNETVSNTLSFVFYQLALNPGIQEKLQSEIDHYFEEKPVSQLMQQLCACISNILSYINFRMLHYMKHRRLPISTMLFTKHFVFILLITSNLSHVYI